MEFIKPGININFIGRRRIAAIISATAILVSLAFIFIKGLNYGIDFAGGIELRVEFREQVKIGEVRKALRALDLQDPQVQSFIIPGKTAYTIKTKGTQKITPDKVEEKMPDLAKDIFLHLQGVFGKNKVEIISTDMVGPRVGSDLRRKGLLAIIAAIVGMLIYIGYRFDYRFSPGAIVALVHDVIITVGIFVILGKEFNLTIIAALLTIAGYSINDTIIVFDRIREERRRLRRLPLAEVVNTSINETLSRTILTSGTTLLVVVSLFVLGGEILRDFALAMIVGIVVGTYSSIFIASPVYVFLENQMAKRRRGR